jgi:hypothetical protein
MNWSEFPAYLDRICYTGDQFNHPSGIPHTYAANRGEVTIDVWILSP